MPTKPEHMPRLNRRVFYSAQTHYRKYRNEIRQDCQNRCVYCDIHETEAGGPETMTLDHLRPKKLYPELEHDPTNLVWACSPCNQFKGSDWPAYGLPGNLTINGQAGYLDPFSTDRKKHFKVMKDGSLKACKAPAEYMIYSLALNRPFLRYIRHRRDLIYHALLALEKHFRAEIETFDAILADGSLSDLEKMRWTKDKMLFEAFLELVLAWDEEMNLD